MYYESTTYAIAVYAFIAGGIAGMVVMSLVDYLAGQIVFSHVIRVLRMYRTAKQVVRPSIDRPARTFCGGDLEFRDD